MGRWVNGRGDVAAARWQSLLLAPITLIIAACSVIHTNNDGAASTAYTSPLVPYLAAVWGTGLDQDEQLRRAEQREISEEDLIAQCMRDAGFEYIPFPEGTTFSFGDPDQWRPNDQEWVAQNGYGMFIDGARPDSMRTTVQFRGNPNWDQNPALDTNSPLSEAEWQLFVETLQGPFADPIENGYWVLRGDGTQLSHAEYLDMIATSSCQGRARTELEATSPMALAQSSEFAPLFEAINRLNERLFTEVSDADREWSICMDNVGYPDLLNQRAAQQSVQNRSSAFWEEWTWETHGTPERHPEMIALRELEIEIALADLDCRIATNFIARQAAHHLEIETQFVNDHREALAALKAAAEQRG